MRGGCCAALISLFLSLGASPRRYGVLSVHELLTNISDDQLTRGMGMSEEDVIAIHGLRAEYEEELEPVFGDTAVERDDEPCY